MNMLEIHENTYFIARIGSDINNWIRIFSSYFLVDVVRSLSDNVCSYRLTIEKGISGRGTARAPIDYIVVL